MWGVFLAEGIRALIRGGRWDEAVTHAQKYCGVGQRLLDGRQASIIAHCLAGRTEAASNLVADSAPEQPWEHLVASCLDELCGRAAGRSPGETVTLVQRMFLEFDRAPGLLVFRTHLGLTILDLTTDIDRPLAHRVFTSLIGDILATAEGYAAREVLAHKRSSALLGPADHHGLTTAVQNAGLGLGAIPAPLMADLVSTVQASETVIEVGLGASSREATEA